MTEQTKRGFWSDLRQLIGRHSRGLLITIGSIGGLFLVGIAFLAHESEKPEFCLNCHIMKPYYESWQTSTHKDVNCLDCHFKPGVQGFFRRKVVAFSQFVRYITVTYGGKPWAELPDASCMQAGCHEGIDVQGPMEYRKGIAFDHASHLQDPQRGIELRCTTCHSQIVQGTHMTVTDSVCYGCHFKPQAGGLRDPDLSDCRTCHKKGISSPLAPEAHALFIDRGTDCTKCHFDVIRGAGQLGERRCEACHSDPQLLAVADPEVLHPVHVSNHDVECFQCHEEIRHSLETIEEITNADCSVCHATRHETQRDFYRGKVEVPFGEEHPAAMIEAHVACSGCHYEMETGDRPTTGMTGVAYASGKACDYCHGPGYDRLLADWHSETARRIQQLGGLARIVEGAHDDSTTRIADTRENIRVTLDVIRDARAVHNIEYSATLLDYSQDALTGVTSGTEVGPVVKGYLWKEMKSFQKSPSCLQRCHYGITNRSTYLKNQDRTFAHAPHINVARLDCGSCHSREVHKVNLPRGYDCISCHHENAADRECAACHQDIIDFAGGGFAGYDLRSPQNADCDSCHSGPRDQIVMLNRNECRECHMDDEKYLAQLDQEVRELKRLTGEVEQAVQTHWETLDFEGLRHAERVEQIGRIGGIHNYALARRVLQDARAYLTGTQPTTGTTATE